MLFVRLVFVVLLDVGGRKGMEAEDISDGDVRLCEVADSLAV